MPLTQTAESGAAAPLVVRADPRMRRQALAMVIAGAVIGVLLIGWGLPWLERWVNLALLSGDVGARRVVCIGAGILIALVGAGAVVSGVNMIRIGTRVLRSGRFPPEGMRVLRDTPVVTGPSARLTGHVQRVLGAVILACAITLAALGGYVVFRLWP